MRARRLESSSSADCSRCRARWSWERLEDTQDVVVDHQARNPPTASRRSIRSLAALNTRWRLLATRLRSGAMLIRSLDHLVLTVADITTTVEFYESLGMRREAFGDGRVALRFGDQKLNLHQAGAELTPRAAHPTPGSADLCFLVADDLDHLAESLARLDVHVELGPVARTGATSALKSLYVRDPDGNLVELSQTADP